MNHDLIKEAVYSSAIEGIYINDDPIQPVENYIIAVQNNLESEEKKLIDNYVNALEFALEKPAFTTYIINKIHRILFEGIQFSDEKCVPGTIRTYPVWIGGKKALHHKKIENALTQLWSDMYNQPKNNIEDKIGRCHHKYEKIHPYFDGNGRTGRILIVMQSMLYGMDPAYLSEFIYNNRSDYYLGLSHRYSKKRMGFFFKRAFDPESDSINNIQSIIETYEIISPNN